MAARPRTVLAAVLLVTATATGCGGASAVDQARQGCEYFTTPVEPQPEASVNPTVAARQIRDELPALDGAADQLASAAAKDTTFRPASLAASEVVDRAAELAEAIDRLDDTDVTDADRQWYDEVFNRAQASWQDLTAECRIVTANG